MLGLYQRTVIPVYQRGIGDFHFAIDRDPGYVSLPEDEGQRRQGTFLILLPEEDAEKCRYDSPETEYDAEYEQERLVILYLLFLTNGHYTVPHTSYRADSVTIMSIIPDTDDNIITD